MDKKSSLKQILIVLGLVGVAFYLGSSMQNRDKPTVQEQAVEAPQQQLAGIAAARQVASTIDVNLEEFDTCVADPEMAQKVRDQEKLGTDIGVSGTPGAFLYDTVTKKAIQLGGAVPLATMEAELAKLKAGEGTDIGIAPINEDDFVKGNENARYVLIEWSDYECPFCLRFQETATQLVEQNEDVKWVYRQFPLDGLHPNARDKSIAALCVGKIAGNDTFWEFSDMLLGL
ncbi:thioredoxin domain-containing protein [Patescibacteria group bacterium]|nr:thioredoxin domain-containing protein [Patescibacteria group bacterium]